ncbi:uncharacterized protein RSE6_02073 [Rhynchosporium secalis]|uniref:Uncharacterized protein n=1 Tax=Rhynchosporium secalis TaxID=38038 RepID=A0A1E1LZD4_RHYSE|nr:uncharacterized protein RSE6_02073 [Rhynchosporium secalis]
MATSAEGVGATYELARLLNRLVNCNSGISTSINVPLAKGENTPATDPNTRAHGGVLPGQSVQIPNMAQLNVHGPNLTDVARLPVYSNASPLINGHGQMHGRPILIPHSATAGQKDLYVNDSVRQAPHGFLNSDKDVNPTTTGTRVPQTNNPFTVLPKSPHGDRPRGMGQGRGDKNAACRSRYTATREASRQLQIYTYQAHSLHSNTGSNGNEAVSDIQKPRPPHQPYPESPPSLVGPSNSSDQDKSGSEEQDLSPAMEGIHVLGQPEAPMSDYYGLNKSPTEQINAIQACGNTAGIQHSVLGKEFEDHDQYSFP